ncbi:MAG: hypothetical protein IJX49_06540 [Clostridia bacterium]|nr:hypothetical protein [Clostridia bacterium]
METQIKKYQKLNEVALKNGVVIFGEGLDTEIPASELGQSFGLEFPVYNRSFLNLGLDDAIALYDACVKPLMPDTILLHIGANDSALFTENKAEFEKKYIALIEHIKATDKKCRIVVVSVDYTEISQQLKYIADSTQCEFGDISSVKVWNPQTTKNVVFFAEAMGVRRYCKKPVYDLLKIFFNYL